MTPRRAKSAHVAEMQRRQNIRYERARDELGAANMNDTKWHEVFTILATDGFAGLTLRMKCLGFEHVWMDTFFRPVNRRFTDGSSGPFEHRIVEWLEVTGEGASTVRGKLAALGQLPIVACRDGFRIQAYGGLEVEH